MGTKHIVDLPNDDSKFLNGKGQWSTPAGSGSGDVVGPSSAVDSNVVEFDATTGKLIKDGGLSHTDAADAINKTHLQQHAMDSGNDHSGTLNSDRHGTSRLCTPTEFTYTGKFSVFFDGSNVQLKAIDANAMVAIVATKDFGTGVDAVRIYEADGGAMGDIGADNFNNRSHPLPSSKRDYVEEVANIKNIPDDSKLDYTSLPSGVRAFDPNPGPGSPNGCDGYSINKMVDVLVRVIQQMSTRIITLEDRIEALENP